MSASSIAWSSDYYGGAGAGTRGRHRRASRFILPKEGSNITYNALLIPASAPHPEAAHKFLNFILEPEGHRRDHQRHPLRQRQSRGASLRREGDPRRPGGVSAAGAAGAAVPAGRVRRRLRPGAHAGLDAHQNGAVGPLRPRPAERPFRRPIGRPARRKPDFKAFSAVLRPGASFRDPGNVNLRPHVKVLIRDWRGFGGNME